MKATFSTWSKRIARFTQWFTEEHKYTRKRLTTSLPYRIVRHGSPLAEENKSVNLKLAAKKINGILIKPCEAFSFWKLVGHCTKRKGYVEFEKSIGGGLNQLSGLIFWMVLHTPMDILESHQEKAELYPDDGSDVPFGCCANVLYNFLDLRFCNRTPYTFQINIWFNGEEILGEIVSDEPLACTYQVFERENRVVESEGRFYRSNEVWRSIYHRLTGDKICEDLLMKNFGEVMKS